MGCGLFKDGWCNDTGPAWGRALLSIYFQFMGMGKTKVPHFYKFYLLMGEELRRFWMDFGIDRNFNGF
ncbi:MAG: hypothetical protein JWM43_576 [Acidobacteriaceae bacterium]|nr:hypothetical protein [Acidobacteriaceae bacterium]